MFKEDKNLYKTVFNILPDAIVMLDSKGVLLAMNDRIEDWLGYKREELSDTHLLKLPILTTKAKVIVTKRFADRMMGKKIDAYEVDFKAKDGSIKVGLIRASVIRDQNNKAINDIVLITDTTKDKFLTTQIADVERKYKYLFDNLPYAFAYHKIVLDKNKRPIDYIFEEVNKNFENMTGLLAKDVLGKKVTEVVSGIEKEEFDWIATYGKVAADRQAIVFESFSVPLNKWFKISAYSPEENYFVTIFQDISAEKINELELTKGVDEIVKNLDEITRLNKIMENRGKKLDELKNRLKKS